MRKPKQQYKNFHLAANEITVGRFAETLGLHYTTVSYALTLCDTAPAPSRMVGPVRVYNRWALTSWVKRLGGKEATAALFRQTLNAANRRNYKNRKEYGTDTVISVAATNFITRSQTWLLRPKEETTNAN